MRETMRTPFFWLATFALVLAIAVELASSSMIPGAAGAHIDAGNPGWGIRYLAILDFLLLYTVVTMGLGILLPRAVIGRVQGIVALVLSFFGCLGTIVLAFLSLAMLILMISLLVAVPFGTIAYMAAWGHFPADEAEATLALIMFLKIAFCVLLLLAEQRFLQNKGLVVLTGVSLVLTWLIAFLVGFPPFFLVSITDVLGALVIAIVGIVWLVLLLIGSIVGVVKAIRSAA